MACKKGLEFVHTITKRLKEMNTFDRTLDKIKVISAGSGKCSAEFTVEPQHSNPRGTLHGGFSATLVDVISTFAIMTHPKKLPPGVSIDIHMTYMSAAKIGEEVVIEANTRKTGKTLAFLDVVIKNKQSGQLLVSGTHTKFIGE